MDGCASTRRRAPTPPPGGRWLRVLRRSSPLLLVALVASLAPVSAAPAAERSAAGKHQASSARKAAARKAVVRRQLRRELRRSPAALRRRSFLRRAALVNFQLPVTIRLRNACMTENGQNPAPGGGQNCLTQGTALNQRTLPTASINLGPSLGSRQVVISGALGAVVEFQDTYDGGSLGNVTIKLLPGDKTLQTSSVPLLWNDAIADPATRSDANWLASLARPGGDLAALQSYADGPAGDQGCGDWATSAGEGGTFAGAPAGPGYKALFHGAPYDFGAGTGSGLPGYPVVTVGRRAERRVPAGAPGCRRALAHPGRRHHRQQRLDRPEHRRRSRAARRRRA